MYKLELQWKELNVNLAELDAQLRVAYSEYVGNQAANTLELWFKEEPSQAAKDAIEALWTAVDEEHALVISYKSSEQLSDEKDVLEAAIITLKQDAVTKSWDQLSVVQRKALMGLPITQVEIDTVE